MTGQQILDKRARVREQMNDLLKRAANENRTMSADEQEHWDKWDNEYESLTSHYNKIRVMEERAAQDAAPIETSTATATPPNYTSDTTADPTYRNAYLKYLLVGPQNMTEQEKRALNKGAKEIRGTSTQSTTGNLGGYTIPTGFLPELEKRMKLISGIASVAKMFYTDGGNVMYMPTVDDTSAVATLVTEGTSTTVADITFAQKQFDAYVYRTLVKFSTELMMDSAFDIEAELTELLAYRFGRALNLACTTGTGSSQPNGVVTASTLGKTAASATAWTRSELLDLIHSVDPVYRNSPSARLMFHDTTLKKIKQLEIGAGDARPLWVPSIRDGAPDTIEGYQYVINQDMSAAYTTGTKPLLFGDFSKYYIRMVKDVTIRRLDELYALTLETGLLGYIRFDGECVQANAINHLALA